MDIKRKCQNMDNSFMHSQVYLTALGQWPYQSCLSSKFFRYFWIIQHISIMLPEGIKIVENRKNINLVIESMPPFIYNAAIGVKFLNGIFNQHKIRLVLRKVKNDWDSLSDEDEIKILSEYGDYGKSLNIAYICMVYFVLLSYMFLPLSPVILDFIQPLNESRPKVPLYMVQFFVDQDKYFYSILLHAYITSLAGVMSLFGSDILLSNCVHHACGMLTILRKRIKRTLTYTSEGKKLDDEKYKQAVNCVIQHQDILEFCDEINKIYSTSFFFVLSISIIMMSVTGVVTVIKLDEDFNDFIRFAMFTIAQIFHIFCYNFMGQNLLNYGEKLTDYLYNSEWYMATTNIKYIAKIMIMRSLRPSKIQAKIFPLTLENFTSVMKSSMSYFTVLKSTR